MVYLALGSVRMIRAMIIRKQIEGCTRRVWLRRYSKAPKTQKKEEKNAPEHKDDDNSALVQRFTEILESKLSEISPSFISKDPQLTKLYNKYSSDPDKQFKATYQKELSHLKNESLLNRNRHAKDIADTVTNKPWDGTESVHDVNLRMLLDLKPPPIKYKKTIITPPMSFKERIENAKESSLDYKIGNTKKEEDKFRELYKEKLLGPSAFLNSSSPHTLIGMANTLADAKINASINHDTGQFHDTSDMSSVRGKPLDREHLRNCTDSNYFMNHILQKQEILHPWIDSQQSIDRQTIDFRKNMDGEWFKALFYNLKPTSVSRDSVLDKIEKISGNPPNHYDNEFHSRQLPYIVEKTKSLNNLIRDYNLQSPSSSIHKFKLRPEVELRNLYDRTVSTLRTQALAWYENEKTAKERLSNLKNNKSESMFGLFDNGGGGGSSNSANGTGARQRVPEKLHLWRSIKEMFK